MSEKVPELNRQQFDKKEEVLQILRCTHRKRKPPCRYYFGTDFFQNEPEQVEFVRGKYQNTSFSPVWKPEKVLPIEYESLIIKLIVNLLVRKFTGYLAVAFAVKEKEKSASRSHCKFGYVLAGE